MGFHSRFQRGDGNVVKGTLDVQKDPQSVVTIKNRFLYVTNNSAKGYVTGVILPKCMSCIGEVMRQVCSASQSMSFSSALKKNEVREIGLKDLGSW